MTNICDEFNTNCLVRSCCTELCSKVGTLVDSYLNYHIDNEWILHEVFENGRCPVCHKDMFWFKDYSYLYYSMGEIFFKLTCNFCFASYEIINNVGIVDDLESYKIIQKNQCKPSTTDSLLNIKDIKDKLFKDLGIKI